MRIFNNFHKKIKYSDLNEHRVNIIRKINQDQNFKNYFLSAKEILYALVGNELSMQNRINLSIQFPNDASLLTTSFRHLVRDSHSR